MFIYFENEKKDIGFNLSMDRTNKVHYSYWVGNAIVKQGFWYLSRQTRKEIRQLERENFREFTEILLDNDKINQYYFCDLNDCTLLDF